MANTIQGALGPSGKHSRTTRVQKQQYLAAQARRRASDKLRHLEERKRHYKVLEGAGSPPSFSGSDMGLSGRYAMGGSAAGKTGWGYDEVTV